MVKDEKIFVYLRLQDEQETLLKSRTREFRALGKLLADFIKKCWEEYSQSLLKTGTLEFVDANTDIVLISFRHDLVRCKLIIAGLIPKKYQARMLHPKEAKLKFSSGEFIEKVAENLHPLQKAALHQNIQQPSYNILELVKQHIKENGEFYITLDTKPGPQRSFI